MSSAASSTRRTLALGAIRNLHQWLPWGVLVLALGTTYQLWSSSRQHETASLEASFMLQTELAAKRAEQYIAIDERILKGVQGLFRASQEVNQDEFMNYTSGLLESTPHNALSSIAYVRIENRQEDPTAISLAYAQSFRQQKEHQNGYPEYSGLDTATSYMLMQRSRESGETALSPLMRLGDIQVLQLYLPIYENAISTETTPDYQSDIAGWIISTIDANVLFQEVFGGEAELIRLQVFDGDKLIYTNSRAVASSSHTPLFHKSQSLQMLDRIWEITASSTPLFESRQDHSDSRLIAVFGTLISICLFGICLLFMQRIRAVDAIKQINQELSKSEQRWKFALEGAGDGIWDWDITKDEVMRSPQWKLMLGMDESEDISVSIEECKKRIHPEDLPHALSELDKCLKGESKQFISEHRMVCNDGTWRWVLARAMVVSRAEDGTPLRLVGTHTDISRLKESEHLVWRQANFDQLTNLPNRRMFYDRLSQETKKSNRLSLPLALLFLDLDHFKEVNDTMGHDKGDLLLQQAAIRISECVRETDTVARLGGDEFIIILSELDDLGSVNRVAQEILEKLAQPFKLGEEMAFVSASMGITIYPDDGISIDHLLKNVDRAMYTAKENGRGRFSYFMPEMQLAALYKMQLTNDLRTAVTAQQFHVIYQPIIELASGTIRKAEALIRWNHPERGLVSPAEFIPIAEETGLIVPIGNWVFREAVGRLKRWRMHYHPDFQISINKSPVQFRNESQPHHEWFRLLRENEVSGNGIVVEITEGLLLDASELTLNKLLAFRDAGIQVALDDFGTGYSSLAYLRKFDIDFIKIDQSFIRNITPQSEDMTLCESIIAMAHKLGLKVIAEGVETEEQRRLLMEAGCDFGQGYLFSAPLDPEAFEQLLAGHQPLQ